MKTLFAALGILSACAPNDSGSTLVECKALSPTAATPSKFPGTVFTIVLENHSRGEIWGNKNAKFLNKLAEQGARADGYHDAYVHPSEANYLWMAAGQNFDILDDDDPASHPIDATSHIGDQLEMAGLSWKSYAESMGEPCGLSSHGRYAAKHVPFVFFNDVNGWDGTAFHPEGRCQEHVVDYTELDKDIANGTVPRYAFITPNLDHDMHDGSIADADAWLAAEVPKLMASDAYKKGGAIIILGDEGGGYPAGDDPPFMVIGPNVKAGLVSNAEYDTSSYLSTVEAMLGVGTLPCGDTASRVSNMSELFTSM